jgi:tetratricopeptide (TPR) repeat protein
MFGSSRRRREKAVERSLAALLADPAAATAAIDELPRALQAQALVELARRLGQEDQTELAGRVAARALELEPDNLEGLELHADLELELGRRDRAIDAWRRIVDIEPANEEAAGALAKLLIDADRAAEAIELLADYDADDSPDLALRLGEALFVTGSSQRAFEILSATCHVFERALKLAMGPEWQAIKQRLEEAERLRDDVDAELHGQDAVIESHLREGKLDARAGVNFTLLGGSLAAKSAYVPPVLVLESVADGERRAADLLARDPSDATGLVLLGSISLRRGELDAARSRFEQVTGGEAGFAAYLGIGAALDHDSHRVRKRVKELGPVPAPDRIEEVVPDYPALTDEEKRVVCASAHPLRGFFPALIAAGAHIRILPIDVRVTDLPELAGSAGQRHEEDHRSYDALGGVATHGCAAAKIEGLLDVASAGGWTFAHELAHLALFHAPDSIVEEVAALLEDAIDHGYACDEYQLSNPDEFFAVAYTDYLRTVHDLPPGKENDDQGLTESVLEFFAGLAARDRI